MIASLLFILAALTLGFAVWAFRFEVYRFRIRRYRLKPLKPLSKPLTFLHLSDIHFAGPDVKRDHFFDQLALMEYDFVVLTGDIIDCDAGLASAEMNLMKLKPRCGAYAVLGNHDYYNYMPSDMALHNFPGQKLPSRRNSLQRIEEMLQRSKVCLLRNHAVDVCQDGIALRIHGIDDPTTGRANVRQTMQGYTPEKINILLAHSIDVFLDIGDREIDLAFSGHSHGGQVCLPFFGPLVTHTMIGRDFAAGIKVLKGAICSVSRGVGTSRFLKLRFLCPPEAVLITLDENGLKLPPADPKRPVL